MNAQTVVIPWDSKEYTVSATTMSAINSCMEANGGVFSAEVAKQANALLTQRADKAKKGLAPLAKARVELYIYAMFVGDRRASEMTWLSRLIGGNEVREICVAAAKKRLEPRKITFGVVGRYA